MGGARTQSRPVSKCSEHAGEGQGGSPRKLAFRFTGVLYAHSSRNPADIDAIFALTQAAFADHPHSEQTEGYINDALRRAGALTLSLVAHEDGRQVGHAAFSPVTIGDGSADWCGLGPAVLPGMQGRARARR